MRRIAATALATGTLVAGMAFVATPAEAAAKKWKPKDAYSNIYTWGTYSRANGKTYVKGYLRDTKKNGWTACVRFLFTDKKGRGEYARYTIVGQSSKGAYHFDGKATVTLKLNSKYNQHMWVQECGRNKKTGKYVYGKGKKLF